MAESYWRINARRVIHKAMRAGQELGLGRIALEKHVSAAYPFGPRSGHPYKIWLSEVGRLVRGEKIHVDRKQSPSKLLGEWPMTEAQRDHLLIADCSTPLRAWRLPDGRYRLESIEYRKRNLLDVAARLPGMGGVYGEYGEDKKEAWIIPETTIDRIGAARVLGVIIAAFCHEPCGFGWADQVEVDALRVRDPFCRVCKRQPMGQVAIIEICGEPGEAELVYAAEFRKDVEG
jgi:hypothetical protein